MMPGLIHYNYNYQNSWPLRKLVCGLDIHNLHRKHEITFDHWNCILKLTWSWFPEHSHQRWNTAWCSFSSQTPCISCHDNTHLSHFSPRRMPWDLHKHSKNPSWFLTMKNLHLNSMTHMTQNTQNENMNNTGLVQNMWALFHSHHQTQQNQAIWVIQTQTRGNQHQAGLFECTWRRKFPVSVTNHTPIPRHNTQ
jgi:hypothetical protein